LDVHGNLSNAAPRIVAVAILVQINSAVLRAAGKKKAESL
jgi:hypothetical protein